jgi:hypothetical protein
VESSVDKLIDKVFGHSIDSPLRCIYFIHFFDSVYIQNIINIYKAKKDLHE